MPYWWRKPLNELGLATFNARVETVENNPSSGRPSGNRCLMPVSGYYEWQDTPAGKQPHYFTAKDGAPAMTMAGLWNEMEGPRKSRHSLALLHDDHHPAE